MKDREGQTGARLFVVYLGGKLAPGRIGEDHEVVVVAAVDVPSARKVAKAKWSGLGDPHVDAILEPIVIDGYEVTLVRTNEAPLVVTDTTYVP